MRAEGLDPLGEPEKRTNLGWNPKGRIYPNIARLGGIDRTEGREEMFASRTPQWAYRPPGKVSIPIGRKCLSCPQCAAMRRVVAPFRVLESTLRRKVQRVCILNGRCLTDALLLDGPAAHRQEMPSPSSRRLFSLLVILAPLCGQTQWSFLPKPHMRV